MNVLLRPRLGGSKLREQPHGPSLHTGQPVLVIDDASLFVFLVAGPGTNGPLVGLLMYLNKAGLANTLLHRVNGIEMPPRALAAARDIRAPAVEDVVKR